MGSTIRFRTSSSQRQGAGSAWHSDRTGVPCLSNGLRSTLQRGDLVDCLRDLSTKRFQMTSQPSQERSPRQDRNELSPFQRLQIEHFARADEAKFLWQTKDPYLAKTERALLEHIPLKNSDRLLEVG